MFVILRSWRRLWLEVLVRVIKVGDTFLLCSKAELVFTAERLVKDGYGVNILFNDLKIVIVSLPEEDR